MRINVELIEKEFKNDNNEIVKYYQLAYYLNDDDCVVIPVKNTLAQIIKLNESIKEDF